MRGFLGFLLLVATAIGILAILVVPMVVRPMVVDAVRASSPFGSQPVEVEVDVNAVALVAGTIDRIRVTGANLVTQDTEIGALDVTLTGVATSGETFAGVVGDLRAIGIPFGDGTIVEVEDLALSGSSEAVEATATLDTSTALRLVGRAFGDAGLAVDSIELGEGVVRLGLFGQPVDLAVEVDEGALILPDVAGLGELEILAPGPDDPWRLTDVLIAPGGMEIVAIVEPEGLLSRD